MGNEFDSTAVGTFEDCLGYPKTSGGIRHRSKISDAASLGYAATKARVRETLENFGVGTIGLYSLHSAFGFSRDAASRKKVVGSWRALVELRDAGVLTALGVSNFNARDLRAFAADPDLGGVAMPDALQNKYDVYRRGDQRDDGSSEDVLVAAADLGVAVVAYSTLSGWPFGFGALGDPLLAQIAATRKTSVATLVHRWALDRGAAIIPRSSSPANVRENLGAPPALAALTPAERAAIDALPHLVAHGGNAARTRNALRPSARRRGGGDTADL